MEVTRRGGRTTEKSALVFPFPPSAQPLPTAPLPSSSTPRPHPSGMPDPEPHEAAAGQKDNHLLITLLSPLCSLWESRASSLRSQACLPPAPLLSPVALAPVIGTWEGRVVREGSLWGSYLCWVLQPSLRQRDAHTVSVSDRDLMSSLHLLVPSLLTLRNVRRKGRGPHARTPL